MKQIRDEKTDGKSLRVLVTGSSGLLGSSLLPYLQEEGFKAEGLARTGTAEHNCDIANQAATAALLDKFRPDAIVNLVALTSVNECEKNPNRAFRDNVRSVESLAAWISRQEKPVRFVHISSDHVYSGPGPHREENPDPVNTYAITKLRAEEIALRTGGTVLRTNFFGPHLNPARKGFWEYVINSLREARHFRISDGTLFNPVAIPTLCQIIALVLKNPKEGIFNVGSRDGFSKGDFVKELCRLKNWQECLMIRNELLPPGETGVQLPRPDDMRMDCGRFEKNFKFRLPTLSDEIRVVMKLERENS